MRKARVFLALFICALAMYWFLREVLAATCSPDPCQQWNDRGQTAANNEACYDQAAVAAASQLGISSALADKAFRLGKKKRECDANPSTQCTADRVALENKVDLEIWNSCPSGSSSCLSDVTDKANRAEVVGAEKQRYKKIQEEAFNIVNGTGCTGGGSPPSSPSGSVAPVSWPINVSSFTP